MDREALAAKLKNVQIGEVAWNGYRLESVQSVVSNNGIDVLSLCVQIPLRGRAIQVVVAAPRSAEPEVQRLFPLIVGEIKGRSSWDVFSYSGSMWVVFAICLSGYLLLLGYGIMWIVLFAWRADLALTLRIRWLGTSATLILLLAIAAEVAAEWIKFRKASTDDHDWGVVRWILPLLFLIVAWSRMQALQKRRASLRAAAAAPPANAGASPPSPTDRTEIP